MPLLSSGRGWRIRLCHEHVAVGQHVQPARMVEIARERAHGRPGGGDRAPSAGQPTALTTLTVGISDFSRCRQDRTRSEAVLF